MIFIVWTKEDEFWYIMWYCMHDVLYCHDNELNLCDALCGTYFTVVFKSILFKANWFNLTIYDDIFYNRL